METLWQAKKRLESQENFRIFNQNHIFAYIVRNNDFFDVVIQKGFSLMHTEKFRTHSEAFNRCSEINS